MSTTIISHTLDLALRLVDTTTGRVVVGQDITLLYDGKRVGHMDKGGHLILTGRGRNDFTLTVRAPGYEPRTVPIRYEALEPHMPYLELQLIPSPDYYSPVPCLTLSGNLPTLKALSAVKAGDSACLIREFDPRKRLLTLFNPHKLELDRTHYALVNPDEETFEPFQVLRRLSDRQFKIDRVLETQFGNYFPICPVVFGRVDPDGGYCLRVRDDSSQQRWLLRLECGADVVQFKTVDFRKPDSLTLGQPAPCSK